MAPYWSELAGNAHSRHPAGQRAAAAVVAAAEEVAAWLGGDPEGLVWTSGATEANHAALQVGLRGGRVVTVATEHPSVLASAEALRARGVEVVVLGVDAEGGLDLEALRRALEVPTALVSTMVVNHEVGALHPIATIAELAHAAGALLHADAAQAGWVPLAAERWGVDLLSVSAHKVEGPKGVGALWARPGTPLGRWLHGGGLDLRPGTLPVPLIVGFGEAARLRRSELASGAAERVSARRDELWSLLREAAPGAVLNGPPLARRAPQNLNVRFPGVDAEALLMVVGDRVLASTGAACSAGLPEPSPVLLALGLEPEAAEASVRFGLGRSTSSEELRAAVAALAAEL